MHETPEIAITPASAKLKDLLICFISFSTFQRAIACCLAIEDQGGTGFSLPRIFPRGSLDQVPYIKCDESRPSKIQKPAGAQASVWHPTSIGRSLRSFFTTRASLCFTPADLGQSHIATTIAHR
jgi:hypothetical protein